MKQVSQLLTAWEQVRQEELQRTQDPLVINRYPLTHCEHVPSPARADGVAQRLQWSVPAVSLNAQAWQWEEHPSQALVEGSGYMRGGQN